MPFHKVVLLIILSLAASFIFSKTVERSLKIRGLPPKKVSLLKKISFTVMFITLLILGLF
jgi:hypothetical protein